MIFKAMFGTLFISLVSSTYAAQGVEERIQRGRHHFEKFVNKNQELQQNEYFLVSLATAISPKDLDELVKRYAMQPISMHFCTKDGVVRTGLKPSQSAVDGTDLPSLISAMGGDLRYVSPVELGNDLTHADPRLCGFEAVMSLDLVKEFNNDVKENLLSIEIRNKKRRFFAVNHNLRDRHD